MLPGERPVDGAARAAGLDPDPGQSWVPICGGSRALCREYGLVLEAAALPYDLFEEGGTCTLWTPASQAVLVRAELARYAAEGPRAAAPAPQPPFGGAAAGAIGYGFTLLLVAYCAGIGLFGVDWLDAGAIDADSGMRHEWWRAITSLTLHLGPEHLFGNLLFGIGAGVLLSRQLGAGVAWLSILGAGAFANLVELAIAPVAYRAAGASTAVFAALGMLTGHAWRLRTGARERWLYRAAPLGAGVALLALLGAGTKHVDVLGHVLGFLAGLGLGSFYALIGMPRSRRRRVQAASGAIAAAAIAIAWILALRSAGA
ncbi:MAG TPA: rhomboid family intramembrane serine protease [Steroidobacteraceae bacterium]|nr:rhomboid family intramembrane serine protease [Steroidobacteraceae bacterium]